MTPTTQLKMTSTDRSATVLLGVGVAAVLAVSVTSSYYTAERSSSTVAVVVGMLTFLTAFLVLFAKPELSPVVLVAGAVVFPERSPLGATGAVVIVPIVALLLVFAAGAQDRHLALRSDPQLLRWACLFLAVYAMAGVLSADPEAALGNMLPLSAPFVAGLLVSLLVRSYRDYQHVASAFVVSGLVLGVLGLVEYVTRTPLFAQVLIWLPNGRPRVQVTDSFSSYLAASLLLCAIYAVPYAMRTATNSLVVARFAQASIVVSTLVAFLTATGGIIMGFFILGACLLLSAPRDLSPKGVWLRRLPVIAASVFGLVLVLGVVVPDSPLRLPGVGEGVSTVGSLSVRQREASTHAAMDILGERPILGSGGGAFALQYRQHLPVDLAPDLEFMRTQTVTSHSAYVDVLVESGLVGFALFVGLMLVSCWRLLELVVASRRHGHRTQAIWATCQLGATVHVAAFAAAHAYDTRPVFWIVVLLGWALVRLPDLPDGVMPTDGAACAKAVTE